MKNLTGISLILLQFFAQISTIKFGFLLNDDGDILNEKFVAFGSIPKSTDEKDLTEISDSLNFRLYHYNRMEKQKNHEIESVKFTVSLFKQAILPDGSYQVALKGELSSFMALFLFSIINAIEPSEIWKKATFYSDPIVIMKRRNYLNAPNTLKVTLLRAAFDNFDIIPNEDLIEYDHKRTMSEAAREKGFDIFDPNPIDDNNIEEEEDRFTVLEFYPSISSLQNPLFDPSKSIKPKTRKRLNCGSCNIL